MASCSFCKEASEKQLKNCVCGKVSYCSRDCQAKDWKTHKPVCPPYVIRESPGKGRGLFATRKIKEGQIILEEYPLFTVVMSFSELLADHYLCIDDETKAQILQLHDPAENIKTMDAETVKKLIRKNSSMMFWKEADSDEISKIFRIFTCNSIKICGDEWLYSNTTEYGLYNNISRINHACIPNATWSWVMGDFQRKQVRAMMVIEKDQEIMASYRDWEDEFVFGSRTARRQKLLETSGFLCQCSECSLEGEDLEDNERTRAEISEKKMEIEQLRYEESRKDMKKAMKVAQRRVKLTQKLNLRNVFVGAMFDFYKLAVRARRMNISCENDPDIYRQEALKFAKMFGDNYIHFYNRIFYA